jgi:hypothetical protein
MLKTPDPEIVFDCPNGTPIDHAVKGGKCRCCAGKCRLRMRWGPGDLPVIEPTNEPATPAMVGLFP